jgi:CRP/FNR family cyclic AMP-dependent transcriptional regulator
METVETYKKDETVIEEGAEGTSAYVILSGSAKVIKKVGDKEITVATMGNGQVFGEMGLIEDRPRSATVKADSNLKVRIIDRKQFNQLLKENPSTLIPIMKNLFERLRQASKMLAEKAAESSSEFKDESQVEIIMEGQTAEAKNALDNRKMLITKFPFLIGRYITLDSDSDVFYNNDLLIYEEKPYVISRNHLSINYEGGKLWAVDRGSAFGIIVNGQEIGGSAVETRAPLDKEQNQIVIGPARSKFIFLFSKSNI